MTHRCRRGYLLFHRRPSRSPCRQLLRQVRWPTTHKSGPVDRAGTSLLASAACHPWRPRSPRSARPSRPTPRRSARLIRQAQLDPHDLDWRRFLVADEGGEVVACAQVRVHHQAGAPELASVAVAAERSGDGGIGRAIAEAAIDREPIRPLYLYTESRTEAFWTRLGFQGDRGRRDPARPAGLAAHRPRRKPRCSQSSHARSGTGSS